MRNSKTVCVRSQKQVIFDDLFQAFLSYNMVDIIFSQLLLHNWDFFIKINLIPQNLLFLMMRLGSLSKSGVIRRRGYKPIVLRMNSAMIIAIMLILIMS